MDNFDFFQWHWWAGAAIVLLIAEIFVPGFFLFCLSMGCLAASAAAASGGGAVVQLIAFSVVSLIAFFTVRPILMKRMWKDSGVRTNNDTLAGQRGRVTQDFEPGLRLGRVSVAGMTGVPSAPPIAPCAWATWSKSSALTAIPLS